MNRLTTQIRAAVMQPKVNLGIGSCRSEGSGIERNFSHKENVILCLELLDSKHAFLMDCVQRAKGKIGCGVTIGHGERCVEGYQCQACNALRDLIADVESVLQQT